MYTPAALLRSNSPYLQKPTKASNKLLHTLLYRNVDAYSFTICLITQHV
jgi:hypothetical protein